LKQLHPSQYFPAAKHSQYSFKHFEFLQLHRLCSRCGVPCGTDIIVPNDSDRVNQSNQNQCNQSIPPTVVPLSPIRLARVARSTQNPHLAVKRDRTVDRTVDSRLESGRFRFDSIQNVFALSNERTNERAWTTADDRGGVSNETTDRPIDRRIARARDSRAAASRPASTATPSRPPFVFV